MNKITKYFSILVIAIITIALMGILIWQSGRSTPVAVQKTIPDLTPMASESSATTLTSTPTAKTVNWTEYTNKTLGFSIRTPEKINILDICDITNNFLVPLKIFEDNTNNAIYIVPEYYYDNYYGSDIENPKPGTSNCETKTYSLQLIKDEMQGKGLDGKYISSVGSPFAGTAMTVKDVKNDTDMSIFIKARFGSDCEIGTKEYSYGTGNNATYNIQVMPGDKELDSNCRLGKILYNPELKRIMAVTMGQECIFSGTASDNWGAICYDELMINSFRFE